MRLPPNKNDKSSRLHRCMFCTHLHCPKKKSNQAKMCENTCMGGPWACRDLIVELDSPGQSELHRYSALKFKSLQVRVSPDILKSTLILPRGSFCNPNCSPLPHPIPARSFPTQGVTQKQELPRAQSEHLCTHACLGSLCDDDKLTDGFTLLPNSQKTNHRQTSGFFQSLQLKNA